jgi:adenine-specific DNA-methyltransferase
MKNTDTFRKDHEYILIAFRSINFLNKLIEKPNFQGSYSNPDNDHRGDWMSGSLSKAEYASKKESENYYTVISPNGTKFIRQFEISKEEFEKLNSDNRISWGKNNDSVPRIKIFINENRIITPYSVLGNQGSTYSGKIELRELFDISDKEDIFDNPKPVSLIKTLIQLGTIIDDSSIILDFFAGSGTTAHSVMSLNNEDGGNRKYILVQIPEQTDTESEAFKAGYKNIAEIGRERIRRAGEKILEENKEKKKDVVEKLDVGFKSYKLTKSNYRQWGLLTEESSIEDVLKQSELFVEKPLVDDFKEEDVVYEILLKEGFDLNSKVEKMKNRLDFFVVTDFDKLSDCSEEAEESRKMYITFAKKVTKDNVSVLALKSNDIFVCLDSALDDTNKINIAREVNLRVM